MKEIEERLCRTPDFANLESMYVDSLFTVLSFHITLFLTSSNHDNDYCVKKVLSESIFLSGASIEQIVWV